MLSRLCRTAGQSVRRTLGLYVVWIHVLPMAPPHLLHEWICSTPQGGCIHPFSSSSPSIAVEDEAGQLDLDTEAATRL